MQAYACVSSLVKRVYFGFWVFVCVCVCVCVCVHVSVRVCAFICLCMCARGVHARMFVVCVCVCVSPFPTFLFKILFVFVIVVFTCVSWHCHRLPLAIKTSPKCVSEVHQIHSWFTSVVPTVRMDMSDYKVTPVAYTGNRPSRMSSVMSGQQRAAEVASDVRSAAGC